MEMIRKTFNVESRAVDPEQGIFEAMISTEAVDRQGDIVVAAGVKLENYLKNPVVLFGHNYYSAEAVVGRALEVEPIPGKGVRARWQFAPANVSEDADQIRRLWAGGFLNATSIGFMPVGEPVRRTNAEGESDGGFIFPEWELLEFSIVPVPANQEALRLALKAMGGKPPEPAPKADSKSDPITDAADELTDADLDALCDSLDRLADTLNEVLT